MRRLVVLAALALAACGRGTVDGAKEAAALRQVREEHRRAHFERDAKLLVSSFAPDFLSIQGGAVGHQPTEESRKQFQAYFDASTFLAWDDLEPPVIGLSDDGTLAYVVAHKRVAVKPKDAGDETPPEETIFAWLETWRKVDGAWKLEALASTSMPGVESNEALEATGKSLAALPLAESAASDYVGPRSKPAGFRAESVAASSLAPGVLLLNEDGQGAAGRVRVSTVWVKDGSRWRVRFGAVQN